MIVKETINNILKPKSGEEIQSSLENLSDEEMVDFVIRKGAGFIDYVLDRKLNSQLNGKLLKYVVEYHRAFDNSIPLIKQILNRELTSKDIAGALTKTLWKNNPSEEQLEIFNLLLSDKRIDPSEDNNILIRWSSTNGFIDLVNFLLQDPRVDPSDGDNAALKGAEMYEHRNIVKLLMNDKRVMDKMKHGLKESLSNILKPKTQDEVIEAAIRMEDPNELLRIAVEKLNNNELVKIAISRGADPNKISGDVSKINNPQIIKTLLTDPKTKISVGSLVYKALKDGFEDEIIKLLKDKKLDPSQKNSIMVVWSVGHAREKVTATLLKDKRIDFDSEKESIAEAVAVAIARGNTTILKMLLNDKRIDPSGDFNRPIKVACQFGNEEAVMLLLGDSRVDASESDATTGQENFALYQAIDNGHLNIVPMLLNDKKVKSKLSSSEFKRIENLSNKIVKESLKKI